MDHYAQFFPDAHTRLGATCEALRGVLWILNLARTHKHEITGSIEIPDEWYDYEEKLCDEITLTHY